ncbi:hypothetical protein [Glycomyces algeriensis]|uniref:Uncharacterized protein n=1 Tax=Glycomyces algeriensis TaxID=256037 RepID=A0A9W6GCB5_9ACTN|nr:hypothetical protein [Glycomyces algeriensis]MDA1365782.1 hypothetical protein [Glycomyces algeriensis]MDR7351471.1 hypothetical protein [Glycomyces algeriensis]GLI44192.1 hypothetical protein GALLR39Z86_40420 [Glycomyces algeriensis]
MGQERVFDPEAIEEYRLFLLELLDALENQVIPVLGTGTLSRAPAFGTAPGAAENAAVQYLEFHAATWRNLQYLRGTLHGMESALTVVAASGGEAEKEATVGLASTESDLAAPTAEPTADQSTAGAVHMTEGFTVEGTDPGGATVFTA